MKKKPNDMNFAVQRQKDIIQKSVSNDKRRFVI